jgi:uncharacterized protein
MAQDVFISHSAKDKTTADAACTVLVSGVMRCRIAPRDAAKGKGRGKCSIDAIRHARTIALACVVAVLAGRGQAQDARGLHPEEVGTGRRLALVIGNKDYPWKPLANPVNDATDVAAALSRDGFNGGAVKPLFNLNERDLKRAVREFVESVGPGDFAFLYYSGHGVEVRGTNYLLPIDLPADANEDEVEDDAVPAQRIVDNLRDRGAAVRVLVLDACRDNPLWAMRSTGGGLARMEDGLGMLIVFAAEAGHTASDNAQGRNGLFTQYLLKALARPGVSLDDAVRDVSQQMAADTNRRQVPAMYGLLERPVFLINGPVTVNVTPAQPAHEPDVEAWIKIKDSDNAQDYEDFVTAFPQSPYAASARLAANRLRRHAASVQTPAQSGSAALTPAPEAGVEADLLINQQRYADARSPAELACNAGDFRGCNDLGWLYQNGLGAAQDYTQARVFLQKACDGGNMYGCLHLGELYYQGQGVPQDYAQAAALFLKSCIGRNEEGCTTLRSLPPLVETTAASTFLNQKKYAEAEELYELACNAGASFACNQLGWLYETGNGVAVNYAQAMNFYKQACDGGTAMGCNNLGNLYWNGRAGRQDYAMAVSLFNKACEGGEMWGCTNLGSAFHSGLGIVRDDAQARNLWQKACNGGQQEACTNLQNLPQTASAPVNPAPAIPGAAGGNTAASGNPAANGYANTTWKTCMGMITVNHTLAVITSYGTLAAMDNVSIENCQKGKAIGIGSITLGSDGSASWPSGGPYDSGAGPWSWHAEGNNLVITAQRLDKQGNFHGVYHRLDLTPQPGGLKGSYGTTSNVNKKAGKEAIVAFVPAS